MVHASFVSVGRLLGRQSSASSGRAEHLHPGEFLQRFAVDACLTGPVSRPFVEAAIDVAAENERLKVPLEER
ncbi:hypothetical protein LPU83_pLPU83d_1056 (plasmid) [Rhizobium favelukesii]|uniref:Uncharacterized protein n=1 Tax=Rhizobium favelukesii TaxID=348824 RepID=W6S8J3_9HYPH|nr:hypothetical protein LPU83_pLPU83d_1056 [Rhizobium favelukesii]